MSDSSMFEGLPLEGPDEEVFSSLRAVYGKEAMKGVQDLHKNSTPFKMAVIVSSLCFLFFTNIFGFFLSCLCFCIVRADERVQCLHGQI